MTLLDWLPSAHAATTAATAQTAVHPQGSMFSSLLLMAGFVLIFYFLLWRPQSKRAKEHRELLAAVSQGDEVMTSGGLLGKVEKISDQYIELTVAENVTVMVQKSAISSALPKGTIQSL